MYIHVYIHIIYTHMDTHNVKLYNLIRSLVNFLRMGFSDPSVTDHLYLHPYWRDCHVHRHTVLRTLTSIRN